MEFRPVSLETIFNVDAVVNLSYYRLNKDYQFPGEKHDCWEFIYIDRGSLIVTAGTQTYFMKSGELAFHCPNEFHAFQSIGQSDVIVVSFYCSSPAMEHLKQKVLFLHRKEKDHLKMLVDESQQVYQHFDNIAPKINMQTREDAPLGGEQLIKNYLEQLLIYICRRDDNVKFSQRAVSARSSTQGLILSQRIQDYLQEHYTQKLSLQALANEMGVSISQIKRIFREQIGQSMVAYVTGLRITQAKRLIREGTLNFSQIADAVGYESIYYFSATFKKQTGRTPTEYQRSLKD